MSVQINGYRELRFMQGCILIDHQIQTQLIAAVFDQGAQIRPRP